MANGDGDGGACGGGDFGGVDLATDGDEVGRELFAGFGGEAGGAAAVRGMLVCGYRGLAEGKGESYDLQ